MLKLLVSSLIISVSASSVRAADAEGRFAIKGAGLKSCGDFIADSREKSSDVGQYAGWIQGYVTGLNQSQENVFDLTPWQTIESMLRLVFTVCEQLPEDTRFIDAFATLSRAAAAQRLVEESKVDGLRHNNQTTIAYTAVVKMIQEELNKKGLKTDTTNGTFDLSTARALESYQADNNLEVTGLPNQATLLLMFLNAK